MVLLISEKGKFKVLANFTSLCFFIMLSLICIDRFFYFIIVLSQAVQTDCTNDTRV